MLHEAVVANPLEQDKPELSLLDVVRLFWKSRRFIVMLSLLGLIIAGAVTLLVPKKYASTVVIVPAARSSSSGLGLDSVSSQLGGLAALAGFSVPASSDRAETLAVLQSDALTGEFIQERDLLPILFPGDWDDSCKCWKKRFWRRAPTQWLAIEYFRKKVRTVVSSTKSNVVMLTITWTDPVTAAKWANELVKKTNDLLRERAISESQRHIAYLNEQASKTDVAEVRATIYSLLESEIKRQMLARGSDEYALRVLDPAQPPERPTSPKIAIWCLVGLLVGIALSFFLVVIKAAYGTRDDPS